MFCVAFVIAGKARRFGPTCAPECSSAGASIGKLIQKVAYIN
jgi:hypothetical protein